MDLTLRGLWCQSLRCRVFRGEAQKPYRRAQKLSASQPKLSSGNLPCWSLFFIRHPGLRVFSRLNYKLRNELAPKMQDVSPRSSSSAPLRMRNIEKRLRVYDLSFRSDASQ